MTHAELKKLALQDTNVKTEYKALEREFSLLGDMSKACKEAGLSQAEVAERMGSQAPSVTRLESSLSSGKHSPSLETLRKYAEVVDCHLAVHLVPRGYN